MHRPDDTEPALPDPSRLLALLGKAAGAAAPVPAERFAVQGSLPAGTLRAVEIEDVGVMDAPIDPESAEQLEAACTPAPFGWRDQTLLDTAVRHTGEIDADRLSLAWAEGAFLQLQQTVAEALGLPAVEAHLHKLLVYGPGQFFKPHQDTQKHPRMFGTLVLVWPGAHTGGALRVWHGRQERVLASAQAEGETTLRWFAFYADCRHEVQPVQEGWRVALTFDLLLPQTAPHRAGTRDPQRQQALEAALRAQFRLDDPAQAATPPQPWVLLLDHEYTEHGLRWELLKGQDRDRVAALRAAAEAQGLVVHLALMELHEIWTAEPSEPTNADDDEDMLPGELVDNELTLDFWVDTQGHILAERPLAVREACVSSLSPTSEKFLVEQAYEGYMGNYGETLDYWYRRAALVIQTPLGAELSRFELDFDNALADGVRQAADPAQAGALALRIHLLMPLLQRQLATDAGRQWLAPYTTLACALPDAVLAQQLLSRFVPAQLQVQDVQPLRRLQERYGTPWMQELLQHWHGPRTLEWPAELAAFTRASLEAGLSHALLDTWFTAHRATLANQERELAQASPVRRQQGRPAHLAALCELAQACHTLPPILAEPHLQALVTHVLQHPPRIQPRTALVPFVQAVGALASRWPQAQPLHQQVRQALEEALAEPERRADDHSLRDIEWACLCADCRQVIAWAESPVGQALAWPAVEARRRHAEEKLKLSSAPLAMETLRQGRPFSLVLRKLGDRWQEDGLRREQYAAALHRLLGEG